MLVEARVCTLVVVSDAANRGVSTCLAMERAFCQVTGQLECRYLKALQIRTSGQSLTCTAPNEAVRVAVAERKNAGAGKPMQVRLLRPADCQF